MSDRATQPAEKRVFAEEPNQPIRQIDFAKVAEEFNYACNGGTGYGANSKTVENILNNYSPYELRQIDEAFYQKFGKDLAQPGERWWLREELADEFTGLQLRRYQYKLPAASYAVPIRDQLAAVKIVDVDDTYAQLAADSINEAFNGGTGYGHDFNQVRDMLVGRRPAEVARIDQLFKAKFPGSNWGIEQEMRQELSGVELAEGLDLLRPNKGTFSNKVQEIHRNIVEMHQWSGRSALEIERDIHDDFSAMSKSSFDQIDFEYRNFYGVSVRDAIMNDSKLSKSLKQEFAIESKGYENITEADKSELTRFAKDRDRKFSDKAQSDKNWEEATKAFGDGVQRGLEQGTRRNRRGPHEANGI